MIEIYKEKRSKPLEFDILSPVLRYELRFTPKQTIVQF